jgi:hypothetical protein
MEHPHQDRLGRGRKALCRDFQQRDGGHQPAVGEVRRPGTCPHHLAQQFSFTDAPFSDDKKIAKAMEAADSQRSYAPKPALNRSGGFKSRGAGKVTWTYAHARKTNPYQKPKAA